MTNWKLLLRKYIDHIVVCEGCTYTNLPAFWRNSPLSVDELAVLRELSEQTTESVAAEGIGVVPTSKWECARCGSVYGRETLRCSCWGELK